VRSTPVSITATFTLLGPFTAVVVAASMRRMPVGDSGSPGARAAVACTTRSGTTSRTAGSLRRRSTWAADSFAEKPFSAWPYW
jgi:hypothetical protein